jgi:hypothetical protein
MATVSSAMAMRATRVSVHLCVPDDQTRHMPRKRRVPDLLPPDAPLPKQGDVLYLNATSAWGVQMVVHQWLNEYTLRIEVWLQHVSSTRDARPTGFMLTQ